MDSALWTLHLDSMLLFQREELKSALFRKLSLIGLGLKIYKVPSQLGL